MGKKTGKKRVLVGGTFDILHPGHIALFKRAARLGDLYVIVARSGNSKRLKGRPPAVPELLRLRTVKSLKIVKDAFLGGKRGILGGIRRVRPDVILLGPDQMQEAELKALLSKGGILGRIRIIKMRKKLGNFSSRKIVANLLEEK